MSKWILTILIITTLLTLVSCDIVYYVAVNNHGTTGGVTVNYDTSKTWTNSDTLTGKRIDNNKVDTILIRHDIGTTSYSFMIPANYQVELQPKSLGTPITSVTFRTDNDSTITVGLFGDNWRQLKRKGIVETKQILLFTHTILINKK